MYDVDWDSRAKETVAWSSNPTVEVGYWDAGLKEIYIEGWVEAKGINISWLPDDLGKAIQALPKGATLVFQVLDHPDFDGVKTQLISIELDDSTKDPFDATDYDKVVHATMADYFNRPNGFNGVKLNPLDEWDVEVFTYDLNYGVGSVYRVHGYLDILDVYQTMSKYASELRPLYAEQLQVAKALYDYVAKTWRAECEQVEEDSYNEYLDDKAKE